MRTAVLAAACTAALCLPSAPLSAAGPETPDTPRIAPCTPDQEPARAAWGGRFGEWLRRQMERDGAERSGYYLRSPLLYAFDPDTAPDCQEDAPQLSVAGTTCAEVRVSTHTDAEIAMALPLPQLGAETPTRLAATIRYILDRGEPVVVLDHEGNQLTLYPSLTRGVRVVRCN